VDRVDLERLAERFLSSVTRRDPRTLALLYASDCRVDSPMFAAIQGRAAVETSFRQWFTIFPDLQYKVESTVIDPPTMVVATLNAATHEGELFGLGPTHKRIEFRLVQLVTVNEDGLIATERRVYDFTGLLVQLGVLRAKPAKT
jgi:steroid delta-isomerase-like uncharacterized protein